MAVGDKIRKEAAAILAEGSPEGPPENVLDILAMFDTVPFLPKEGRVPEEFTLEDFGGSPDAYWSLHSNEKEGREALLGREGGRTGKHVYSTAKGRNWKIDGLTVDPNRWFTEEGAADHVRKKNPRASKKRVEKVLSKLSDMRRRFLPKMLPQEGGAVVSVHNSHPHVRYKGGKTLYEHESTKSITKGVHEGDPKDKLDFLLTTDKVSFDRAVRDNVPFNVIYQPADPEAKDDGSASVWAGKQGLPYFNPEISRRKGAQEKQEEMLRWIEGRHKTIEPPTQIAEK